MRFVLPFVLFLALISSGCGSPGGETWLIRTNQEELSVIDAGNAWLDLDHQGRMGFLEAANPVGEFISALGRKLIIVKEVSCEDYLYSPEILIMQETWQRSASYQAYVSLLTENARSTISSQDLENYRLLIGSVVWYTDESGNSRGPVRLPDLPWEIAFALDTLSPGETVSIESGAFTLDSVNTSPDSMIAVTLADTASVNGFARSSLAESRVSIHLDSITNAISTSLVLDSAAIDQYCLAREELPNSTVLASWRNGELTALDMDGIIAFTAIGLPVATDSPTWVIYTLKNQIRLLETESVFRETYPEAFAELVVQSEEFALEKASDALFFQKVSSQVEITDQMILEAYNNLDSIPVIPETRTFESLLIPSGIVDENLAAIEQGADPFQLGFPGYPEFLAEGSEFISRPVAPGELPSAMATILFLLREDETAWQRPLEIEPGLYVVFRLHSVVPPHAASMTQLEPSIRMNLSNHMVEQMTMEWLIELEQAHNLEINSEIISDLPPDPANWVDL